MTDQNFDNVLGDTPSPVHLTIVRPERSSRKLALATLLFMIPKLIILIPHIIILYALAIASLVVGVIAQFVVLFTGKYPENMHKFVANVLRWQVRVNAFALGLVDRYPPFNF